MLPLRMSGQPRRQGARVPRPEEGVPPLAGEASRVTAAHWPAERRAVNDPAAWVAAGAVFLTVFASKIAWANHQLATRPPHGLSGNVTGTAGDLPAQLYFEFFVIFLTVIGARIASRHHPQLERVGDSDDSRRLGWLLLAAGLVGACELLTNRATYEYLASPLSDAWRRDVWLADLILFPSVAAIAPILILLFPDGRFPHDKQRLEPDRRWTLLLASVIVDSILLYVAVVFEPTLKFSPISCTAVKSQTSWCPINDSGPVGGGTLFAVLWGAGLVLLMVNLLGATYSLLVRHRRAERGSRVRLQIKWVGYGAVFSPFVALLIFVSVNETFWKLIAVGFCFVVVSCIGVALMKRDLRFIECLYSKSFAHLVVVSVLVGIHELLVHNVAEYAKERMKTAEGLHIAVLIGAAVLSEPARHRLEEFALHVITDRPDE